MKINSGASESTDRLDGVAGPTLALWALSSSLGSILIASSRTLNHQGVKGGASRVVYFIIKKGANAFSNLYVTRNS